MMKNSFEDLLLRNSIERFFIEELFHWLSILHQLVKKRKQSISSFLDFNPIVSNAEKNENDLIIKKFYHLFLLFYANVSDGLSIRINDWILVIMNKSSIRSEDSSKRMRIREFFVSNHHSLSESFNSSSAISWWSICSWNMEYVVKNRYWRNSKEEQ